MELIPAIDLRDGRCVRLLKGDFAAETVYSDAPHVVLERYRAMGASRVHVVDLDGARDGTQGNLPVVSDLVRRGLARLQVGGGLRSLERVKSLLATGAQRAVIGSTAVVAPAEVIGWADEISTDQLILGFDVKIDDNGEPRLATHGWQRVSETSLWSAVERYVEAGFKHVLCTDVARDGAMGGPNYDLYREATRRFPEVQWQASGGVSSAADLHALRACGVAAVISGKALLENKIPTQELRPFLPNASSLA